MTLAEAAIEVPPLEEPPSRDFSRARERLFVLGLYAGCVLATLVVSGALIAVTGGSWREVGSALLDGAFRGPARWGRTLNVAVPLMLVAVGTSIGSRAGLINIGQEGQLSIGSAVAVYVGTNLLGPGPMVLGVLLTVGFLTGALWAGIAALLLYWRKVPEVLTTLLLVTVASQLVGYGLNQRWLLLAPIDGRSTRNIVSKQLETDTRIPRVTVWGNEFPISFFVAMVIAIAVYFVMTRTIWGFRLRMLGQNPRTAHRAGVAETRYGAAALMLSGGFAGLAGAVMLAGGGENFGNYQLLPGFAIGIGFDGLLVALVSRQNQLVIIPMAVVFAALRTGSGFLAATGVPREITDVVKALLVLGLLLPPAILHIRDRKRALAAITART